ncbi:nicotinate-nucleotide-dimethylbenzimidazole phosphoribosyltransferase [Noviherbaspirillum humi]|uniref:Nicotinate-nucleotide--dimethylbenzimidazole phosphoribosyltransferase n=1 Tax=Noviherbaspirillum humi TaxID=1688639 RepID=A0A239GQR6_9BURK|nr:nicotinate-nucleotide--dimethylbenzimidazole phosphoribosyltransferase [Noviherbaspirillum humi]SNS71162.1 nicotinate-nucleotide-dimethylbenzimidazole phosphoribosyltransferase [Noviherbaspirillum humi]
MQPCEIQAIHDASLAARLDAAIDNKTKPRGSLGALEKLARQAGLIQRTVTPSIERPAIMVFAGDHGIAAENVSPYPQSVTWQMVENFLAQGAAINVFARQHGCELQVVDAGVNHDFGPRDGLIDRKIGRGTGNFLHEPAMSAEQRDRAMQAGRELVRGLPGNVIGFGEMGIANTSAAAAVMHRLTGIALEDCVGAGAGLEEAGVLRKRGIISRGLQRHADAVEPLQVLSAFGGFEIAMIAGAMLGAAERRMIILVDGFIVTSALLVASRLQPALLDYCVFSHCSDERGHALMLRHLGAEPLLRLGLRLGEGSGCALALPLLRSAIGFLNEMATFDSAGVSERND